MYLFDIADCLNAMFAVTETKTDCITQTLA
jgi:hypothetical protein